MSLTDHHEAVLPRRFAPVTLNDVVSDAALMTRTDRKYLVTVAQAATVLRNLPEATRVLHIAGRRSFSYDSVYFDTADHLSFRGTAQSRRRRFKLRTRHYVDTGTAYLELKVKDGRGRTVKTRIPHRADQLTQLGADAHDFLTPHFTDLGVDPGLISELRPSLRSRYARATLLQVGGTRATVDTELRWRDEPTQAGVRLADRVIIETKSAGAVSALDRELWRVGCRPGRISKFGTGTAALHPHLPRNKWTRELRDHTFTELTRAIDNDQPGTGSHGTERAALAATSGTEYDAR